MATMTRSVMALVGSLALACLGGCVATTSTATRSVEERGAVVLESPAPPVRAAEVVASPPPGEEVARSRPRLAQTVTLGNSDLVLAPTPPPGVGQGSTPSVTINNNVVVSHPPVYGGYGYGGYGYGAGAYGSRVGVRDGFNLGSRSATGSRAAWAPNGWEGAGRTAAPGRTPGVGGNWSPPPSYGPAPMR